GLNQDARIYLRATAKNGRSVDSQGFNISLVPVPDEAKESPRITKFSARVENQNRSSRLSIKKGESIVQAGPTLAYQTQSPRPTPTLAPTPTPTPTPTSDERVEPMTGSLRPTILYREKAKYTDKARNNGVEGTVVLQVVYHRYGLLTDINVIRGLPDGLTEN